MKLWAAGAVLWRTIFRDYLDIWLNGNFGRSAWKRRSLTSKEVCVYGCRDVTCKQMPEMAAYFWLLLLGGLSRSQYILLPMPLAPPSYCLGTALISFVFITEHWCGMQRSHKLHCSRGSRSRRVCWRRPNSGPHCKTCSPWMMKSRPGVIGQAFLINDLKSHYQ